MENEEKVERESGERVSQKQRWRKVTEKEGKVE
jgi:hypothetical protein